MPWFEDLPLEIAEDLGDYRFTEAEIIGFARQFDPQFFHVDPEAAKAGPFGGLVASGWHTVAIWMKLRVARIQEVVAARDLIAAGPPSGPSPGFVDLVWPAPVRPGDTIRYSAVLTEKIELKSRPSWGLIKSRNEGVNQHGQLVLRFTGHALLQRRTPPA
jgi:acyl dehydratase